MSRSYALNKELPNYYRIKNSTSKHGQENKFQKRKRKYSQKILLVENDSINTQWNQNKTSNNYKNINLA